MGRGEMFEGKVGALLQSLESDHPGLVRIKNHPRIELATGRRKFADFELIYCIDQEHHELIECQSRKRSSGDLAAKIKLVKSLSSRNRFIFVFEEPESMSAAHRAELKDDGVICNSFEEFQNKVAQLNGILSALKETAARREQSEAHPSDLEIRAFSQLIARLHPDPLRRNPSANDEEPPYRGPS